MKRDLVFSVLFHLLLLVLAIIIIRNTKAVKAPAPFVATIITPDELRKEKIPSLPKAPEKPKNMPRTPAPQMPTKEKMSIITKDTIPENQPAPKVLSAVPRQQTPRGKTQGTSSPREIKEKSSTSPNKNGVERSNKGFEIPSAIGNKPQSSKSSKERLFDKDVLASLSKSEHGTLKVGNGGMSLNVSDYKYYGYWQQFYGKLVREYREPTEYVRDGLFGDVYIRIVIMKNGYLKSVDVIRSSGHPRLDMAAIRIIKNMEPFWPLPDSWPENTIETEFFIEYPNIPDPLQRESLNRYID